MDGVDIVVPGGCIAGITGENGAGKTTLLRVLLGDLKPDAGRVLFGGSRGYCPQVPVLNLSLTVAQHLLLFKTAYRLPSTDRAEGLMARLNFASCLGQEAGKLSGGTQQKLNLTLALMHDPDVVILDEPYQGLDYESYQVFWELAAELRDCGRTVLVVTHFVPDATPFDLLFRLSGGRLHAEERSQ
ncbi:ABC transporter ATP-binding protein [Streptomyces sp. DK15]|uniref:ABC transporter ATP-binding protein n=1 Tax=Streptomyces sp. DK15 TaxID=2957499 RepID=UPI0029B3A58D|nr:ABC transporter ATP-binding protein [Streptomyces sp. DK15]MDX2395212.1 ABC transporter ATP-binding protein [Streptomyces sp. DK15]